MKHKLLCIALATLCSMSVSPISAQTYPRKPLRMVVGFPPGGGNDLLARTVSPKLSELLSQSVVVDNKPGAGGNVAAEFVSRATAQAQGRFRSELIDRAKEAGTSWFCLTTNRRSQEPRAPRRRLRRCPQSC